MRGISSEAAATLQNRLKFNEGSELNTFLDINLYETDFRLYDPQIGRFCQIDALAKIEEDWSPYTYANNNPILLNDPLGLLSDTTTLAEVTVTAVKPKNSIINRVIRPYIQDLSQEEQNEIYRITNKLQIELPNIAPAGAGRMPGNSEPSEEEEEELAQEIIIEILTSFIPVSKWARAPKYFKYIQKIYKAWKSSRLARKMARKTLPELQRIVKQHSAALRELFGANEKGAQQVLDNIKNVKIPKGVTQEVLQAYRE